MKTFFDDRQWAHDPKHFMQNGVARPNPEQPERIARLTKGAIAAGAQMLPATDHGIAPIGAIHSAEYLSFLQTIHARWLRMEGAGNEVIPNVFPQNRTDSYPASPNGLAGFHQGDTACPIMADTWLSAYWSAQSALSGVDAILAGDHHVYALCRPPGHHAFADMAAGFCFLNNSAIAAQALLNAGRRPVVLDIDVHHGNGTQGIFYERNDVLTVSLHADPAGMYPFFWGHAHERGAGAGLGSNLNLPLPRGTSDDGFMPPLDKALDRITTFGADVIVLALGLDAHENDPLHILDVTTPGFAKIATRIASLGLPVLMVQEGGYLSDDLTHNITSFLTGIQSA